MLRIFGEKLVRDKTVESFEKNYNGRVYTRFLSDNEYLQELWKKLDEELAEMKVASRIELPEEIADLYEVLTALMKAYKITDEEVALLRKSKNEARGSYEKRLYANYFEFPESSSFVSHADKNRDKYPLMPYEAAEILFFSCNKAMIAQGLEKSNALLAAFEGLDVYRFELIGSSCVEGLLTRPHFDYFIEVESLSLVDARNSLFINDFGYLPYGEYGVAGRRFFSQNTQAELGINLHFFARNSYNAQGFLDFTWLLKNNMSVYRSFLDFKLYAQKMSMTLAPYCFAKNQFIQNCLKEYENFLLENRKPIS